MTTRRRYTAEFKAKVAVEAIRGELTVTHDHARRSRGCRVWAANPAPSLRWPEFPVFRRKRRSLPACPVFLSWSPLLGLSARERYTQAPSPFALTPPCGAPR